MDLAHYKSTGRAALVDGLPAAPSSLVSMEIWKKLEDNNLKSAIISIESYDSRNLGVRTQFYKYYNSKHAGVIEIRHPGTRTHPCILLQL